MSKLVGLTAKRCLPCEGGKIPALTESEAFKLRNQARPRQLQLLQKRRGMLHQTASDGGMLPRDRHVQLVIVSPPPQAI